MNRRPLTWKCLVVVLCVFACFILLPTFGIRLWRSTAPKGRTSTIPLTRMEHTGFLAIEARINGNPIRMVIDTGSNTSTFDVNLIQELQLPGVKKPGVSYRLSATEELLQAAHVESFQIGQLVYYGDFSFVDLSRVNTGIQQAGDETIRGILGADILRTWNAVINYDDLTLTVSDDDT